MQQLFYSIEYLTQQFKDRNYTEVDMGIRQPPGFVAQRLHRAHEVLKNRHAKTTDKTNFTLTFPATSFSDRDRIQLKFNFDYQAIDDSFRLRAVIGVLNPTDVGGKSESEKKMIFLFHDPLELPNLHQLYRKLTKHRPEQAQQNSQHVYRPVVEMAVSNHTIGHRHTGRKAMSFVIAVVFALFLPTKEIQAQGLIQTMLEQLAKFEVQLQDLKQGYAIVQNGLEVIGNIKKGDFDLHSLFFTSLKDVNPAIKNWGKVADILAMQIQLVASCKFTLQAATGTGAFSVAELQYLSAVCTNLANLTSRDIDELSSLISDNKWQMTDDDRMARIDALFVEVSEKYLFLRSFSSRLLMQSQMRLQQKQNAQKLQKLILP